MGVCHGSIRGVEQELRWNLHVSSGCEKTATKMTASDFGWLRRWTESAFDHKRVDALDLSDGRHYAETEESAVPDD